MEQVKGYLVNGKFFGFKDEAETFEAISKVKTVAQQISGNLGYSPGSLVHQQLVHDLVANSDHLAPALRSMARFVKRNRSEIEQTKLDAVAAGEAASAAINAVKQLVSKHF